MQKEAKRADAHAARDFRARTINTARSDHDVWDSKALSIVLDDLLLLDLGVAIGVATEFGMLFHRTRLIQSPGLLAVGVHSKRADENNPLQTRMPQAGHQQVARRDDRVHKRVRK